MENKNLITILIILVIGAGAYYFLFGSKSITENGVAVNTLSSSQIKGLTDSQIQALSLGQINAMSFDQLGLLTSGQMALLQSRKSTLETNAAADAKIAADAKVKADEAARIKALKVKMSAYTVADMDKMTAAQLSEFTTEELLYMLPEVKSDYNKDVALYATQLAQKQADDQFLIDLAKINMSQLDKDDCAILAKRIYEDCKWFIFETKHTIGLYQDLMNYSDAKFYYFFKTAWYINESRSFINAIKAQNFNLVDGWFLHRGWTEESSVALITRVKARVNSLTERYANQTT